MDYCGLTSDWHVGNFGYRDRCSRANLQEVLGAFIEAKVKRIFVLGDASEDSKNTHRAIRQDKDNQAYFLELGNDLKKASIPVYMLPGNHNPNAMWFADWLARDCNWPVVAVSPRFQVGKWLLLHGHQFDETTNTPVARQLARGLTWFAGNVIERVVPSFPENWANPVEWFSQPDIDQGTAGKVNDRMKHYAKSLGIFLAAGHTHIPDIEGGVNDKGVPWKYVNCGACVKDAPFSYALFDPQSDWAQLVRK